MLTSWPSRPHSPSLRAKRSNPVIAPAIPATSVIPAHAGIQSSTLRDEPSGSDSNENRYTLSLPAPHLWMRRSKGFIFLVSCLLSLVASSASAAAYTNLKYDYDGGLSTQILTKDKNPYVLCSSGVVKVGRTLTIEPGVVLKFGTPTCPFESLFNQLIIYGTLNAVGSSTDPIIFTSIKDDTVAGDTNGDGALTKPARGDWGRIQLGSSVTASATIRNAIIRYGGNSPYGMLQVWSPISSITLDALEVSSSSNYGLSTFVPLTIHNSSFHGNSVALNSVGLGGGPSPMVDATNNWWGDSSGPTVTSNPSGTGDKVLGNVLYDPWIGKYIKPDPVIIIPGILGSAEKNGVWLIDPIFHTYDDLVDTLDENGYTREVDLFTFPYNWRQSNVLTAFQLHQKIDEVKAICGCSKVDLVGHSMGGLAARQYVQSNYYESDVDQLIFLGTPHLGAPKSYLSWESNIIGIRQDDEFLEFILTREAHKTGYDSLFEYIHNNPITSVQELLPIYDYLRDNDTGVLRSYPNNYPRNIFLENLNNTPSSLFSSNVKITNIVGNAGESNTINILRVVPSYDLPLWEHGYPDGYYNFLNIFSDRGLEMGSGDITVPEISSKFINVDIQQVSSSHRLLPTNGEDKIYKKLTTKDAQILIKKFNFPDVVLIIKLLSPVDMVVVAPDGKRIGKDFATNQEVNEIDGAFYSGFIGDDEYITIPNPLDGEYKVETIGTDNGGEYTVAIGLISDQGSSEQDFTATTLPGMITDLNISINNASSTIEVTPVDTEAPIITIISPEARDYTRDDILIINTTSTDIGSGVLSQEVAFDGKIISSSTLPLSSSDLIGGSTSGIQNHVDLFFQPLSTHIISVTSTDFVGNVATSSTNFRIIATFQSTIYDIDRAFQLEWLSADIRDSLTSRIRNIIRQSWNKEKVNRLLTQFLNQSEQWHEQGLINDSGYNLLIEDINWLLNN